MPRDNADRDATGEERSASGVPTDERQLIVEFAIPTDHFLLASALSAVPNLVVEFERLVPTGTDPLKCLWTADCDRGTFEEAAMADPTVGHIRRVAAFDQGTLYGIGWVGLAEPHGLFERIRDEEVTVLQSEATDGEWLLKPRLSSREALGDLRTYRRDEDIDFRLVRLFSLTEPKVGRFNVSEKQREVLLAALEMGYFEIPREATLDEVADALDISTNSASERLRRAQTNFLNNTPTVGQPTGVGIGDGPESDVE